MFYQDIVMKKIFTAFPEMLFVDATHKVNEPSYDHEYVFTLFSHRIEKHSEKVLACSSPAIMTLCNFIDLNKTPVRHDYL